MKFCEYCQQHQYLLRKMQTSLLAEHGVDPEKFISATPNERMKLVIENFRLNTPPEPSTEDIPLNNRGLLVVKPEMFDYVSDIENCLANRIGLKILTSQPFTYTPEVYWAIYGKNFLKSFSHFPHGALLLLLNTCLQSQVIVFEHFTPERYREIKKSFDLTGDKNLTTFIENERDPQAVFDRLFVRDGTTSMRSNLCYPKLRQRGFLEMQVNNCPGQCWDFTGAFAQRTFLQNQRTFNGVHCPGNSNDLMVAFNTMPIKMD